MTWHKFGSDGSIGTGHSGASTTAPYGKGPCKEPESASRRSVLYPIPRLGRDQRRRHDAAVMPAAGQQPMQPIAARAGFVTKAQALAALAQPRCQLDHNLGPVLKNPDLANLALTATFGKCHRDRRLVHIPTRRR